MIIGLIIGLVIGVNLGFMLCGLFNDAEAEEGDYTQARGVCPIDASGLLPEEAIRRGREEEYEN